MSESTASTTIKRTLSIGINVKDVRKLPKVGRDIAKFLKSVDHEHGPFDVNIAVSVEPTEAAMIGPIEFPKGDEPVTQTIEIIYEKGDDDDAEGVE